MKTVLVTGASGFTGSFLANELARRGNRVRAMVRHTSHMGLLDSSQLAAGAIQPVYADLRDRDEVDAAVAGAECVYHVAALYRVAKFPDQMYRDVNVTGTDHVLRAAIEHGVQKVVHCSTIGVHGGVREIPATEASAFAPGDIYQSTKLQGERLAAEYCQRGLPTCIVRPAGIYGPGDLRFLKLFKMVKTGRFIMFGSGQTLMHMVYISDLVDGMIQAMESVDSHGKTLILAGEHFTTLNDLVALVAQAVGCTKPRIRLPLWPLMLAAKACEAACRPWGIEPPLHERRAAFFTKDRAFSIEAAKREIGFRPQVALAEGLRLTADWYVQQGLL